MSALRPPAELARLRLLVLDVDGVLTDGTVLYGGGVDEVKAFHTRDGAGLALWRDAGLLTTFITGRGGDSVRRRAEELRIGRIWERARDKTAAFDEMLAHFGVTAPETLVMGDDVPDLRMLERAGFAAAPADASPDVLPRVHYVARAPGGHGAVREVIEHVLRATGRWDALMESIR